MAGPRVCDLYAYGLVQHIPHKSYMAQIYYATTFAVFYFPFADPSRIFRGHMLKPFYINANTRTFRSMLICWAHRRVCMQLYVFMHARVAPCGAQLGYSILAPAIFELRGQYSPVGSGFLGCAVLSGPHTQALRFVAYYLSYHGLTHYLLLRLRAYGRI